MARRTYYIVYRGLQRYRNGKIKPRIRVRKIRNVEGRPKIVDKRIQGGDLWVTIKAPQVYTLRNGKKVKLIFRPPNMICSDS